VNPAVTSPLQHVVSFEQECGEELTMLERQTAEWAREAIVVVVAAKKMYVCWTRIFHQRQKGCFYAKTPTHIT